MRAVYERYKAQSFGRFNSICRPSWPCWKIVSSGPNRTGSLPMTSYRRSNLKQERMVINHERICENEMCENPGVKEVPVSVHKPSDQKRTFCVACEEAYTIGCQHAGWAFKRWNSGSWRLPIRDHELCPDPHQ